MTILWREQTRRGLVGMGIKTRLGTHAISIYAGTQPTSADQFIIDWAANYTSASPNFLGHYQGAAWHIGNWSDYCTLTTIPAAQNALNNGTASWAVLWAANPALGVMGGTIPTTALIIVPCSTSGANGVIQFTDLTFTAAISKAIASGQFITAGGY